ncbi:helix-turn-helix transcriptional regulator [Streptomyces olivoreticuli]
MDDLIRHPLAYARLQYGLSQTDLATRMDRAARTHGLRSGADRALINKYERGIKSPNEDTQLLIAEVFDIARETVRALGWPDWLPGHDNPMPFGPNSTVSALREALKLSVIDRRAVIGYTGASLAGLAFQWAVSEPSAAATAMRGNGVDIDYVEILENHSAQLTAMITEQRQHAARLLDAYLTTVTELIADARYTSAMGRRLHSLAAGLSQTLGWYYFDHGRHATAARFWHSALHSAHASGNRDFGAGVLSDLAYQATWLRKPQTAVEILDHAITRAGHPTARSLLHLRKARAHAALGEAPTCNRSLAAAEQALESASGEPSPSWCAWMSPSDLAMDSGRCLLDLGDIRKAHQLIEEGTGLLPRARMKTQAIFLVYEADSFLRSGDVDEAASAASTALTMVSGMGAPRCVALVRDLVPAFKKHTTVEGVPELLELVRAS